MKTYYKAYLSDDGDFKVTEISKEEARGVTQGLYDHFYGDVHGTFAVRETKSEAMTAIREYVVKKLTDLEKKVRNLKGILETIDDYGRTGIKY